MPLGCSELEDVAAELALGILPGDQRAVALAHLDRCHECRLVVRELADAVDTILTATPATASPRAFSRQVTRRIAGRAGESPRSRWRRAGAAAAAMAALALTLGLSAPRPFRPSARTQLSSGAALTAPGVRMAGLVPVGQERMAGVVFLHPSQPSWVFMTVTDDEKASSYECELEYRDGRTDRVGVFSIHDGAGAWRQDLVAGPEPVTRVNILTPEGALVARATFR